MSAEPLPTTGVAPEAVVITSDDMKVVPKPWGEERCLAHTDRYAGKLPILKSGHHLSLQYHERKHEVQYVEHGRIRYTLGSTDRPGDYREVIVEAGTLIVLPPGAIHRMEALEDSRLFEMSTPDLEDVVRIEDDYGRADTRAS